MLWAEITLSVHTDLTFINDGVLTALRYRNEILKLTVLLYTAAEDNRFIFIDDNCRSYRT